jgi:hypothetical protein
MTVPSFGKRTLASRCTGNRWVVVVEAAVIDLFDA